jgi:hypothetical protein
MLYVLGKQSGSKFTRVPNGGRFVKTALLNDQTKKFLESNGLEWATAEDVAKALIKLASDPGITGQ